MVTQLLLPSYWGSPKMDMGGCVLYLPFYRPDMVARGGRCINGTGTATGSPIALLVGATTITTTVAGTFLIYVPYAATCASGTATITGSPVTLNPGVNTVTQTGAVGTFTVTTSNIFRSKDQNSLQVTNVGAVWSSQGYTFDGNDDYLEIADNAILRPGTGDYILSVCLKIPLTSQNGAWSGIFQKGLTAAGPAGSFGFLSNDTSLTKITYFQASTAGSFDVYITTGVLSTGYHVLDASRVNTTLQIFIDGTYYDQDTSAGANLNNTSALRIGKDNAGIHAGTTIPECFFYTKGLSASKIMQHYLSAKRRMPWANLP